MAGLNRTFMELKFEEFVDAADKINGLNRTFMELKFKKQQQAQEAGYVLIEPLWN